MISRIARFVCLSPARRFALIVWLSILCYGSAAPAQSFDATDLRGPTDLAGPWLVHAGDDPAYARPDFDDSNWTPFNPEKQSLHDLFHTRPDVVWYRLHVKVAGQREQFALLEHYTAPAFEIYVNGERVLTVCRVVPYVPCTLDARILLPITESQMASGTFLIALRVHISKPDWSEDQPGFYPTNLTLGLQSAQWEHMWLAIIGQNATHWLDELVLLVMGIGALLLFRTQRDRDEYLWLFLLVLCEVPNFAFDLFSPTHAMPMSWWRACQLISVLYIYFFVRMFCSFFGHRVGRKLEAAAVLAMVGAGYSYLQFMPGDRNYLLQLLAYTPFFILCAVVLPSVLIPHIRHGKYLESVLLIPLALADLDLLLQWILLAAYLIPAWRMPAIRWSAILLPDAGPFTVDVFAVIRVLQMGSLALIILLRSNRMSRQQAVIETELGNARELQQVILPGFAESVPGFKIESVYQPARELGGDFFQILRTKGDGVLLVIGDVAGKGLPAALPVSILIGAIRTLAEEMLAPEMILFRLNEALIGRTRGGFSTALVAEIARDGGVTIANAGHLPPFLDGRDVEIAGALPLGVVSGVIYESSRFQLSAGSRLTFCTDGVSEAQDKELGLFGFDRAREISTRPAAEIAEAARTHGQEDDITVVTIERMA